MKTTSKIDLYSLQEELAKSRPKKKKKRIVGSGFAKQKQVMEESGYYSRTKRKPKIKIK
ncbi:MAG: hypothetical protein WC516_01865 [Patescibacteria group bacterium]